MLHFVFLRRSGRFAVVLLALRFVCSARACVATCHNVDIFLKCLPLGLSVRHMRPIQGMSAPIEGNIGIEIRTLNERQRRH